MESRRSPSPSIQSKGRSRSPFWCCAGFCCSTLIPLMGALLLSLISTLSYGSCKSLLGDRNPNASPEFPQCIHALGPFGGTCGNCKWKDHASRCSLATKPEVKRKRKHKEQSPSLSPSPAPAPKRHRALIDDGKPSSFAVVIKGGQGKFVLIIFYGLHELREISRNTWGGR